MEPLVCLCPALQAIPGVPKIHDGHNPATWMLEISTPAAAEKLGVDFAEAFKGSGQFRCALQALHVMMMSW